jgi:hypothetical protein
MKRHIDLSWYSLFHKKPLGDCFVAKHEGVMEKTPLLPLPEGMLITFESSKVRKSQHPLGRFPSYHWSSLLQPLG